MLKLADDGALLCAMGRRVLCLEGGELASENGGLSALPISCLGSGSETTLAGSREGLWRSTDRGRSWECVLPDVPVVAVHVASRGEVYAASMGGQVWKVEREDEQNS